MKGTFRSKYQEIELSNYIKATANEVGATVISCPKGQAKPKKFKSDTDVLKWLGTPSADFPALFDIISYVRTAPIWVSRVYGEGALWGGIDILASSIVPFSTGRVNPDSFVYSGVNSEGTFAVGTGDGTLVEFSGTITDIPLDEGSLKILVDGVEIDAIDSAGEISGDDIDVGGTNTIDYTTGAFTFTFETAPADTLAITFEFIHNTNETSNVSHSFFASSPYTDCDIAITVKHLSGKQYFLTIYEKKGADYFKLDTYTYSLIREKDGYNKNIYLLDVLKDNPYLIPKINANYTGVDNTDTGETKYTIAGGYSGATPTDGEYSTNWDYFKKPNKYYAKNIMDITGNACNIVNTIIQNYQYYAHGISVVPMGLTVEEIVAFRSTLALDSSNVSLYCNWRFIKDNYNDSYAWISNVGSVGVKYAEMEDVFDGLSPAGLTGSTGHGGQISDWETIEMEHDFDDFDKADLDNAQINPVILDGDYGVKIEGDRTLNVKDSDMSFVATRRLDNYILEKIIKNVMKLQEFKNNSASSQFKAKTMTETFLSPILAKELVRDIRVVCDDTNNTDEMKTQRKFILDIIKKSMTNNQETLLRLTRTSQGAVLSEIIPV